MTYKHGQWRTREFRIWTDMLKRCDNPNFKDYGRYGGRGIKVCARWREFVNFYEDMGEAPLDKTLERIDNNGDYMPSNCRWATMREQSNNRSSNTLVTVDGIQISVAEAARRAGISRQVVAYRKQQGWPVEEWFIPLQRQR